MKWVTSACYATILTLASLWSTAPAQAGVLDEIKARGSFTVATEASYPPFEFMQNNEIVGFDEDVLKLVVAAWGVKLQQSNVPFAGILAGLIEKKYDFVCTALIMNPERTSRYAFTMPVAVAPVALIKRKGDTHIASVADLTGLKIGAAVPPSGPTSVLKQYLADLGPKGNAQVMTFQSAPDSFLALANGQVDLADETTLVLNYLLKKRPGVFEIVGTIGKPFYYGWAARGEDTDLRDAINVEIAKLNKSGKLAELQKKWFGFAMDAPTSDYLPPGSK